MKSFKFFLLSVISALIVSACGGGGSSASSSIPEAPPGIYTSGTVTPTGGTPDSAVALITTDNRVAIVDLKTNEAFIGTISNNKAKGTMYSYNVVPATGQVTSVSGSNISGTYSSSLGGGTFALVANPNLFARGASLSSLSGTWVDSKFISVTGTTTWVIQTDGSFSVTSTSGCAGTGQFTLIDPTKNEFGISITITNCLTYNGTYSGIAALSDTYNPNDTLSFIFNNGSNGGLFQPIKQ